MAVQYSPPINLGSGKMYLVVTHDCILPPPQTVGAKFVCNCTRLWFCIAPAGGAMAPFWHEALDGRVDA